MKEPGSQYRYAPINMSHEIPTMVHINTPTNKRGSNVPVRARINQRLSERVVTALSFLLSTVLSVSILSVFTVIALIQTFRRKDTHRPQQAEDFALVDEMITCDEAYYIERWGYQCGTYDVETEDGHLLRMYRVSRRQEDTASGASPPVLLAHGLFQCSGAFVANEKKSLAFVLVDRGYDVWIGNTRATGSLHHVSLSHKDQEYWAWGLKELAIYDLPALIAFVQQVTGHAKVAYIGHSQGNAQMFVSLSLKPDLSQHLSCFVALAPAVFSGHLHRRFPLRCLVQMDQLVFRIMFGTGAFLPIMSTIQRVFNPVLFSHLAYSMFSYLFSWWDHHWLRRRKAKYFQFTPRPVSTQLIADWLEGWGRQGVCLYVSPVPSASVCVPANAPHAALPNHDRLPFAVFYGTEDHLVDGERLVNLFESTSAGCVSAMFPMLDLVHVERIEGYEHMDTIWAYDNHMTTYPGIFKVLDAAKWEHSKMPCVTPEQSNRDVGG